MRPWPASLSKALFKQSQSIESVSTLTITENSHTLTLLASPSKSLSFDPIEKDPFIQAVSKKLHDSICVQQDPSKPLNRFRHFLRNSSNMTIGSEVLSISENPTIQNLLELKATLEGAFYLKEIGEKPEDILQGIFSNILSPNFLSYPFTASSLIYSIIRNNPVEMIDMPDSVLSINVARSLKLEDLKEMHRKVLEDYKLILQNSSILTSSEILHSHYPEVFQQPRDLWTISLLQKMLAEGSLLAVVSAPTFEAVKSQWKEKIVFEDVNKLVEGNNEKDEIMVEKIALLDAVLGSRSWGDKYLYNRFPYIGSKAETGKTRKFELQGIFHSKYLVYSQPIEEIRLRIEKLESK